MEITQIQKERNVIIQYIKIAGLKYYYELINSIHDEIKIIIESGENFWLENHAKDFSIEEASVICASANEIITINSKNKNYEM